MQTCCGVNPFFQLLQNLFLGLSHVSPHLKQMDVRSRDTGPLYLFIFKLVMALETLSLGHLTFAASQETTDLIQCPHFPGGEILPPLESHC